MTTLDEAWAWYLAAAGGMKRLSHLAKHWDSFPWDGEADWIKRMQKDEVLRHLEANQLAEEAKTVQQELDDLAVLVLFSVFEAIIRDLVEEQIRPEIAILQHAFLKTTSEDILRRVTEGSFFHVLETFKSVVTDDLTEQVNQVRHYRNWVAHGRRPRSSGKQMATVQPKEAFERLSKCLALIRSSTTRPV